MIAGIGDLGSTDAVKEVLAELGHVRREHWLDAALLMKFERNVDANHLYRTVPRRGLWRERLAFRYAIRADSTLRQQYAGLKADLLGRCGDRPYDAAGKRDFIAASRPAGIALRDGMHVDRQCESELRTPQFGGCWFGFRDVGDRRGHVDCSYAALMRKLVVTENITLDGVIDASGGWFAPGDDTADLADVAAVLQQQAAASDALLLGRTTFEEMRAFWPNQTNDTTGITAHLNQVQKFVTSSTMTDPEWENTTILSGAIADEVAALKVQQGKDIVTTGSITLVHELIALGLVDEYRLFTYPVVLGHGRRLFQDVDNVPALVLQDVQRFGSTVVLATYQIAG